MSENEILEKQYTIRKIQINLSLEKNWQYQTSSGFHGKNLINWSICVWKPRREKTLL